AEAAYGRDAAARIEAIGPDAVLCANTPLDALGAIQDAAAEAGAAFVNWLQDALSVGARAVLSRRLPVVGTLVGRGYEAREGALLRRADAVVAITDDFRPLLRQWRMPDERVHVVENWAPLADLPVRPQDNAWSRAQGLAGRPVALYAGTLGMKHDPALLARLAEAIGAQAPAARVVVVSEGAGADWLRAQQRQGRLGALTVLPFQPFDAFPDVLGTASVLTAVLEPEAGVFSVPSKVLSYLCAARPVVLSVPPENLAARIVDREGAGVVAAPGDAQAFVEGVLGLLGDAERRDRLGAAGRAYAERAFDIEAITDRFEAILTEAVGRQSGARD
ncbi:MAG: glycosyltransferase family 4 protein, partial [Bacteroidota bacterium]